MSNEVPGSVPIPSDVERPDKVLAGLTARQVAIATVAAAVIWAGFQATRHFMPLPAFAALATPVGLIATALVIGERDGLPLDRLLLAAAAPVLLALYALPQTAWAARWWWRALTAALAIQVAQGLVMTAAVQVFFSPGWLPGDISSALGQTLITLCLLYILMRIPFWVARPVLTPFGRSPLRRAVRFALTAAVFSRIAPLLRGGTPPKGGKSGKSGGSGSSGSKKGSTP